MKCLNLKVNGSLGVTIDSTSFSTDITDSLLPDFARANLESLITKLQDNGHVEIHMEKNETHCFTHKVSSRGVDGDLWVDEPVFNTMDKWVADYLAATAEAALQLNKREAEEAAMNPEAMPDGI